MNSKWWIKSARLEQLDQRIELLSVGSRYPGSWEFLKWLLTWHLGELRCVVTTTSQEIIWLGVYYIAWLNSSCLEAFIDCQLMCCNIFRMNDAYQHSFSTQEFTAFFWKLAWRKLNWVALLNDWTSVSVRHSKQSSWFDPLWKQVQETSLLLRIPLSVYDFNIENSLIFCDPCIARNSGTETLAI